jgi:FtsP/CotA-like multicopper oxidase with cupredoxin domain
MNDQKRIFLRREPGLVARRKFVTGVAAGSALLGLGMSPKSSFAASSTRRPITTLRGNSFDIDIGYKTVNFTGRERPATAFNGSVPGPILRWREGDRVTMRVSNHLAHDSSEAQLVIDLRAWF